MRFDIFCRVIDNFGDIGVCWRLTRQLAQMQGNHHVTLWVDDLSRFQRIENNVKLQAVQHLGPSIKVVHWTDPAPVYPPGDVVIEAFNCELPESFVKTMVIKDSLWINLEYLSAEPWVDACHALPSLQSNGLKKFFFFPGFTPLTGGLLREPGLLSQRDQWLSDPKLRWTLLRQIGVPDACIQGLQTGWRQALLFAYPSAPIEALVKGLTGDKSPWVLLVPQGMHPSVGALACPQVTIVEIPFVDQRVFDQLLWSSDLNFVRGEDSLVRALWAGKPLIWQIYEQEEEAHLVKLSAWLNRSLYPADVKALMMAWNQRDTLRVQTHLANLLETSRWTQWQAAASEWTKQLAKQSDLADNLMAFCAKNR